VLPPALRGLVTDLRREYRPLISLLKRAAILLAVVFGIVTVLPDSLAGWSHPPSVFLGWMKDSFAVTALVAMERSLLPKGTTLIVIGPFDAFTVIMEMGFYIALAVTIPYLVLGFLHWLAPSLSRNERRQVRFIASLSAFLFFGGMLFTYLVILPPIYQFSYSLQPVVGAAGTISLQSFVETSFLFMLSMGLAFELPCLLLGLAYVGFLSAKTMAKNWNYAYAGFWVVAFVISPGVGGGIIEGGIATLLLGLYLGSYGLIRRLEHVQRWRIPQYAG
jgi:sec-independent protein translocase protein TatC